MSELRWHTGSKAQQLYVYIEANPGATTREMADALNTNAKDIWSRLGTLKGRGVVKEVGKGVPTQWEVKVKDATRDPGAPASP